MHTHIETIPALPIAYMRRTGTYGMQNVALMEAMKEWIVRHGLHSDDGAIYAIAHDDPQHVPADQCRYDVCFPTEAAIEDAGINTGTLPGGIYLVCRIPHTAQDVQALWDSLPDLLEREARQLDPRRPIMERYAFSLVGQGFCEFCIPVEA